MLHSGYGTDAANALVFVGLEPCDIESVSDTEILCSVAAYPVGENPVEVKIKGKGRWNSTELLN